MKKDNKEFEMFVDDDDQIYFGPLIFSLVGFVVLVCIIGYFGFFVI